MYRSDQYHVIFRIVSFSLSMCASIPPSLQRVLFHSQCSLNEINISLSCSLYNSSSTHIFAHFSLLTAPMESVLPHLIERQTVRERERLLTPTYNAFISLLASLPRH